MARFGNSSEPSLRLEEGTGSEGQLQYVAFPLRRTRVSSTEYVETTTRHILLERAVEDGLVITEIGRAHV